jgi:hypothetical protein
MYVISSCFLCVSTGVKACIKVMELVDEEPYEITVDIHGIRDGPRLGRLRLLNKVGYSLPSTVKIIIMNSFDTLLEDIYLICNFIN